MLFLLVVVVVVVRHVMILFVAIRPIVVCIIVKNATEKVFICKANQDESIIRKAMQLLVSK